MYNWTYRIIYNDEQLASELYLGSDHDIHIYVSEHKRLERQIKKVKVGRHIMKVGACNYTSVNSQQALRDRK